MSVSVQCPGDSRSGKGDPAARWGWRGRGGLPTCLWGMTWDDLPCDRGKQGWRGDTVSQMVSGEGHSCAGWRGRGGGVAPSCRLPIPAPFLSTGQIALSWGCHVSLHPTICWKVGLVPVPASTLQESSHQPLHPFYRWETESVNLSEVTQEVKLRRTWIPLLVTGG